MAETITMSRRLRVLARLWLGVALVAVLVSFAPMSTGAVPSAPISVSTSDTGGFDSGGDRHAVALVGARATGRNTRAAAVPELRRHDSGRTSFAFSDDSGRPVAPPVDGANSGFDR